MASTLLTLPPEVGLEIVDKLPAKEIQRLRSVCKHLKTLVDMNNTKIAAVCEATQRSRLL